MEIKEAESIVESVMSTDRFSHSIRVAKVATKLAKYYGESVYKAELASLFHDYAKEQSHYLLKQYIIEHRLNKELLSFHGELWHGPVAAHMIKTKYGINDQFILRAIAHHTTGRAEMSMLELIIFVADYIEPERRFTGVEEVRNIAFNDLHLAAWMALRNTIPYLINKKATVFPDTFYAYNDLTLLIQRR